MQLTIGYSNLIKIHSIPFGRATRKTVRYVETVEEVEEIIAVPPKKSKKITKHSSEKKGAEHCLLI